jgi:transcriptional regulator with XRE-family HTH domain
LTQQQFADALGISKKLVDYYERRAPNPSLDFVKKVARFFDVTPGFFAADELPKKTRPGPKSRLDARVDEIKKLPPKQQELVLIMLDSFLSQARRAS